MLLAAVIIFFGVLELTVPARLTWKILSARVLFQECFDRRTVNEIPEQVFGAHQNPNGPDGMNGVGDGTGCGGNWNID